MSELSKRMRESRSKATQGRWSRSTPLRDWGFVDDANGCIVARAIDRFEESSLGEYYKNHPWVDGVGYPEPAETKANAEFITDAANEIGNLCDEIERLEAENAEMRAKLAELYDPLSALDAACRASGLSLADDYEQRLAEWRAYVDSPVDPADLDSALYRAIADDPKAYPPEKP